MSEKRSDGVGESTENTELEKMIGQLVAAETNKILRIQQKKIQLARFMEKKWVILVPLCEQ